MIFNILITRDFKQTTFRVVAFFPSIESLNTILKIRVSLFYII